MEITIEKNVPLVQVRRPGRKAKWPIASLEVNDSFVLPSDRASSVRSLCQRLKRDHGKTFAVRFDYELSNESGEKMHRCWRIS